ncbi:unnamed protein product [Ranitomeya imitator]|uniref:C3H1-type domain-containing protein n=1 Tax=Ranitomeya imitator TaxID=111125 RepID=A0ABN9M3B2_9NEOB|nr:unnamed protein product [Ranitomeya imitator]
MINETSRFYMDQRKEKNYMDRKEKLAIPTFPVAPALGTNTAISFAPYLTPMTQGVGLVPTEILPPTPVIVPGSPPVSVAGSTATQKLLRTDKLEVCREFQRGNCARGETDCRFAHPADSTMIDTNDNTVTVCMDYIKGRCMREKCKYFHPPAHLQAKIKAAQHQANQAAVAAQAAAAAATVMVWRPRPETRDVYVLYDIIVAVPVADWSQPPPIRDAGFLRRYGAHR